MQVQGSRGSQVKSETIWHLDEMACTPSGCTALEFLRDIVASDRNLGVWASVTFKVRKRGGLLKGELRGRFDEVGRMVEECGISEEN